MTKVLGFTLIELMVVVSIISILAAIAIPQYQPYITRAQTTEAISLAQEIKFSINEYYKHNGRFPINNKQTNVPEAAYLIGNFVKSITISNGVLHVELGNKVHNQLQKKVLSLQPLIVTGSPASPISWNCGYSEPPAGMETVGENRTDVPVEFLPYGCSGK